jgi:hypothetical protein
MQHLDHYITGSRSIEELPVMRWANQDFKNLNGRHITDISKEINSLLNKERNWKFQAKKALCYISGTVAVALLIRTIVDLVTAAYTKSFLILENRHIMNGTTTSLFCLFDRIYHTTFIDTRTKIRLQVIEKWSAEKIILKTWTATAFDDRILELTGLSQRAYTLLTSTEDKESKLKINLALEKIKIAFDNVQANLDLIENLPISSRDLLFN